MTDKTVSKDADHILCILYKNYKEKRKSGIAKELSEKFTDEEMIANSQILKLSPLDVYPTLLELKTSKYITIDICGGVKLTDKAIIFMENRFKNGIKEFLDFISQFIP